MHVVKKPFRNFGKVYTVGTVITVPTDIKRFKGKLAEGKIIEVTEQTYDNASKYFLDKFGVKLPPIKPVVTEAPKEKPVEAAKLSASKTVVKTASTVVVK